MNKLCKNVPRKSKRQKIIVPQIRPGARTADPPTPSNFTGYVFLKDIGYQYQT